MYDFGFDRILKMLAVSLPLAILGVWKLIEILVFIFSHGTITIN